MDKKKLDVRINTRGNSYRITSDANQFILEQEVVRKSKTGKRYVDSQIVGYFHNINTLLQALIQRNLKQEDAKTIRELKVAFDELVKDLTRQWEY